jgi:hypothetical protein
MAPRQHTGIAAEGHGKYCRVACLEFRTAAHRN